MNEEEGWGYFLIKRYKKKHNCSLCYNAFREEGCLEFLVYKCLCKCENNEEMCRFCVQYTQKYIHLCKCGHYIERHLCDNLPQTYDMVNKGFENGIVKL